VDSPGFVDEQPEDLPRLVGWQPSTANRAFLSQQVTQETRSRVALPWTTSNLRSGEVLREFRRTLPVLGDLEKQTSDATEKS
jgi:hypothetical protein